MGKRRAREAAGEGGGKRAGGSPNLGLLSPEPRDLSWQSPGAGPGPPVLCRDVGQVLGVGHGRHAKPAGTPSGGSLLRSAAVLGSS